MSKSAPIPLSFPAKAIVVEETNQLLLDIGIGRDCRRLFTGFNDLKASISSMSVAIYERLFQSRLEYVCRQPDSRHEYVHNANVVLEALRSAILLKDDACASLEKLSGTQLCNGDVESIRALVALFRHIYTCLYVNTSLQVDVENDEKSSNNKSKRLTRSERYRKREVNSKSMMQMQSSRVNEGKRVERRRASSMPNTEALTRQRIRVIAHRKSTGDNSSAMDSSHLNSLNSSVDDQQIAKRENGQGCALFSFGSVSPVGDGGSPHYLSGELSTPLQTPKQCSSQTTDQRTTPPPQGAGSPGLTQTHTNQEAELASPNVPKKKTTLPIRTTKSTQKPTSRLYPLLPSSISGTNRAYQAQQKYKLLVKDHLDSLRLQELRHHELLARRFRVNKHQLQVDAIRHRSFQERLSQDRLASQLQHRAVLDAQLQQTMHNVLSIEKQKLQNKKKQFREQVRAIHTQHQRQEGAIETFFQNQLAMLQEESRREDLEQQIIEKAHKSASKKLLVDIRGARQHDLVDILQDKKQQEGKDLLRKRQLWERKQQNLTLKNKQNTKGSAVDPFYAAAMKARQLRQRRDKAHA